MRKIDIVNSKVYLVLASLMLFIFWGLGFFSENKIIIENIALFTVGIVVLLSFIFTDNINNILIFILLIPFVFARSLDPLTIPVMIYVACGCLVIGLIIHYIKTKPKFKIASLFPGLCVLGIAMVFGGITLKSDYYFYQLGIMVFVVIMFLGAYIYLTSTSKQIDFDNIAFMFTILGVFISMQSIIFFISQENFLESFTKKSLDVGWGGSNNIALILLFTFPFTFYLCLKSKKNNFLVYYILINIQAVTLFFTYSKGGIAAFAVELFALLIYGLVINRKEKYNLYKILIIYGSYVFCVLMVLLIIGLKNPEYLKSIYTVLTTIDFKTFNNRFIIYKEAIANIQDNLIFGKGLLFSMFPVEGEVGNNYIWGHSTIIQTFSTMGIFGLLALLYHLFEKYYVLIKQANPEKIIIVMALAGSGLYGLFDVSYYFINYMVILIILFVVAEPYFYNYIQTIKFKKETK